jgi:hypothetical protein
MAFGNTSSGTIQTESLRATGLFYGVVKSLREFDEHEVEGAVETLLATTDREKCFIATYYRSLANVNTLLTMGDVRHFQAIAMLGRGLFELAVDMKLLALVPSGADKMILFADAEKLRCARKLITFKSSNPNAGLDSTPYSAFISREEARIDLARNTMWSNPKRLDHWSGQNLAQRVALVGSPFNEFYEGYYPLLSWYVHSGLTGVVNLQKEAFMTMCGIAFRLAAESYTEILLAIVREFEIARGNEKIEEKLQAAKLLPFTDGPKQADELFRALLE